MENASKALLIAGGVFLAMLILTTMMYMSKSITGIGEAQEKRKAAEQLAAFNAEYEAYNKKLMYGTDLVTVINKAADDEVTIELEGITPGETFDLTSVRDNIRAAKLDSDNPDFQPLQYFECIDIRYDENTGKVNYMKFKKINPS